MSRSLSQRESEWTTPIQTTSKSSPQTPESSTSALSSDIIFDRAQPADAFPISIMSRDHIEYGLPWSWRPARIAWQLGRAEMLTIIARDISLNDRKSRKNNQVIGFAMLRFMNEYIRLMLLAVDPAYRGKGIGAALIEESSAVAVATNCPTMHLEVRVTNLHGQQFYRNLGFRTLVRIPSYYANGEDAYHLYKALA